jgi:glucan phosphoethanolaminetransferase (alkaline phosphatase superfamily)
MSALGKRLAVWGVTLQFGMVFGQLGTVIGMLRAFSRLAETETAQPGALAQDISIALWTTAAGIVMALVGVIMILGALIRVRYRAPWFQTALWALSFLWMLSSLAGIILGIWMITYLVNHQAEFMSHGSTRNSGQPPADSGGTGAHGASRGNPG